MHVLKVTSQEKKLVVYISYSNLTATRKDSVEILDTKHKIPTYGAEWTKKPLYIEFPVLRSHILKLNQQLPFDFLPKYKKKK